ncbi:hypothetical protein [Massilia sp. CCM 8734]|uniref:hypothetical protein n=1 Tax=Massilia sp. CCM 8734 TaxID=2609283 RepID=UPI00141E9585|nr:hypothetical protein [Massilia sp. CCM 8734]NHZ95260.1 hypothetical protein [Massilia sp. CCM 8734]
MAAKYGTGEDGRYCYPNSNVLINKLGITDEHALEVAEVKLSHARIGQFTLDFDDFSFAALRAIHSHLLQDLYNRDRRIQLPA